jgi:hypothetical protein
LGLPTAPVITSDSEPGVLVDLNCPAGSSGAAFKAVRPGATELYGQYPCSGTACSAAAFWIVVVVHAADQRFDLLAPTVAAGTEYRLTVGDEFQFILPVGRYSGENWRVSETPNPYLIAPLAGADAYASGITSYRAIRPGTTSINLVPSTGFSSLARTRQTRLTVVAQTNPWDYATTGQDGRVRIPVGSVFSLPANTEPSLIECLGSMPYAFVPVSVLVSKNGSVAPYLFRTTFEGHFDLSAGSCFPRAQTQQRSFHLVIDVSPAAR